MITAMDEEIGRVVSALDKRGIRDNTLIIFHSDNGGPRSSMFTGEVDTSKLTIPSDNGPYRDGKTTLYEGRTRVVALANWPDHIKPGTVVDQPIHFVDMYPTLVSLAGASHEKSKPLDGLNVWSTISSNKPSPRNEVVYDIEPFRAALRKGDWKLIWKATLPSRVELFDLAKDPSENSNLADKYPKKVEELQQEIEAMAREAVKPLFMVEALGTAKDALFGSVATPEDEEYLEDQP